MSAVVEREVVAPPTPSIASPARDQAVAAAQHDAAAFSDVEEDFFRTGHDGKAAPRPETFDDLDADYQHVGFWDRLRGKKPPRR